MVGPIVATLFLTYLAWMIVVNPLAWIYAAAADRLEARRTRRLNRQESVTATVYPWER